MVDAEYLVKQLGDVEAEGAMRGEGSVAGGGKLFLCAPGFCGEGEFQLVAIIVDVFRTTDGAHAGAVDIAQSFQVVAHLTLLGFELGFVAEGLPFASTANAEVRASGIDAEVGETMELHGAAFGIVLFLLIELDVDYIARHHEGYENHQPVDLSHSHTLGTGVGNGHLFKQGQISVSSSHTIVLVLYGL